MMDTISEEKNGTYFIIIIQIVSPTECSTTPDERPEVEGKS